MQLILATPSIGGTVNIITDPTQHKAGAYFRNEYGTGNFSKQTFFGHTGLVDGKFAMSFGGVRKVGEVLLIEPGQMHGLIIWVWHTRLMTRTGLNYMLWELRSSMDKDAGN